MITAQTIRWRRGRAIRKVRRVARTRRRTPLTVDAFPALCEGAFHRTITALTDAFSSIGTTALVAASRVTPLIFPPRGSAGARRQLLERGRAPRRGRG